MVIATTIFAGNLPSIFFEKQEYILAQNVANIAISTTPRNRTALPLQIKFIISIQTPYIYPTPLYHYRQGQVALF